jgi:hypothetical protein
MTGAEAFADASNPLMAKVRPAAGRRFFDAATAVWMMKVFPGEFYMTKETNEVLVRCSDRVCQLAFAILSSGSAE